MREVCSRAFGNAFFRHLFELPALSGEMCFFRSFDFVRNIGGEGGASAEDSVDTDLWRSQLVLVESAARRNGPCKTVAWNV